MVSARASALSLTAARAAACAWGGTSSAVETRDGVGPPTRFLRVKVSFHAWRCSSVNGGAKVETARAPTSRKGFVSEALLGLVRIW